MSFFREKLRTTTFCKKITGISVLVCCISIFILAGDINFLFPTPLIAQEIISLEKEKAPAFSLKNLSGKEESLKDYRGKVLLLNFWATWCPPCREEMPALESLYRTLKDQGFVVLGISSDAFGERAVKPFVEEFGLTFPMLLDQNLKITHLYRVNYRPTSYLVDRQGNLITRVVGPQDWMSDEIIEYIKGYLVPASTGRK